VSVTASNCPGIPTGDYTVQWSQMRGLWYYTAPGITICFDCDLGGQWVISIHCVESYTCTGYDGALTGTCSPFYFSGTITVSDANCNCGSPATITVSVSG
jgi:hypothetical protein